MSVIFGRNRHPLSILIRLFEWSRWSHCGIVVGDYVIESTSRDGVVRTHINDFKKRYNSCKVAEIPCYPGYQERAEEMYGKPYDFGAIFGIMFRQGWSHNEKWFCSELIAHASGIFREERISRITPEDVWKVSC